MHLNKLNISKILTFLGCLLLLYACANIAAPTGGLYDVDPPKVVKAKPEFNALNNTRNKIEIIFDENIKIEKPMDKVIIAPPQQNFPIIKAHGQKAIIEIQDELIPNTTYTIDFTDAIVDNNEGNALENFSYSFSTGDKIDSLAISGTVLNAENLEPCQGIYVGIHSNLNDTAFTNIPFLRISRTDSRGRFTIKGIAEGEYKIYALNDKNRSYSYDDPQEEIAFMDSVFIPTSEPAKRNDTIFIDSLTIDTIHEIKYTRFMPDDIILKTFESGFARKYLQKNERKEHYKLDLFFAAPTDPAQFKLLEPSPASDNWYVKESSATNDTLSIWITDSLVHKSDTIVLELDYLRTDSLNNHVPVTDTISFAFRGERKEFILPPTKEELEKMNQEEEAEKDKKEKKKKKDKEEKEVHYLRIQDNIQSTHEIYNNISLEFEHPLKEFDAKEIKLQHEIDSTFTPIEYTLISDSLNPRKYQIIYKWQPGEKYQLTIDSAAYTSVYGIHNKKIEKTFSVKKLEEYGNLMFVISGLPEGKTAYVELLDAQDKPFRKTRVKNNEALFMDLNPGKLYARLFIDENEDGEWTTGDYSLKRMPETVYYNPKWYEIRAYTNHEESWDLNERSFDKQKPLEITKNKPEEKKKKPNRNEEQERKRNSKNRSQPGMNFGGGMQPTRR